MSRTLDEQHLTPRDVALFDAALTAADEHLALDACLAWVAAVLEDDWTAMHALLARMGGNCRG